MAGLLVSVVIGWSGFFGCAKEKATPPAPPPLEKAYVGAGVCQGCHPSESTAFEASGHPHILTPVAGGQKPGAPLLLPDDPPPGTNWSQIRYVVGGFGWKALFVTTDNMLVTGQVAQWDVPNSQFPAAQWAPYHADSTTYDDGCFRCHTTGPDRTTQRFQQAGVQCESCHGPGSVHAATTDPSQIVVDQGAAACGTCHQRPTEPGRAVATVSVASGDTTRFVSDYQQWTEMEAGPHADLRCVVCHDPHRGVRQSESGGIVKQCQDCHGQVRINHPGPSDIACIDCHMPRATISARPVNVHTADVRTHIFAIRSTSLNSRNMYEVVNGQTCVKQGYGLTLDYVCFACHKDARGIGGEAAALSPQQILALAPHIHGS